MYVCMCLYICRFLILFPCKLLQNSDYSSLYCTVGPCWCKPSSALQGTPKRIVGGAKKMVGGADMVVGGVLRMMQKKR